MKQSFQAERSDENYYRQDRSEEETKILESRLSFTPTKKRKKEVSTFSKLKNLLFS